MSYGGTDAGSTSPTPAEATGTPVMEHQAAAPVRSHVARARRPVHSLQAQRVQPKAHSKSPQHAMHRHAKDNPQGWADMMEAITESTINHIKQAKTIGISGALVSIFNATSKFNSVENYERYSRPYDKRVLAALAGTQLTVLHLHFLELPYLNQFHDFNAPVINYSVKTSGIPVSVVRKAYSQTIAGGVDEINFNNLSVEEIRQQWMTARQQAGNKYIITPGCSVPDSATPAALARVRASIFA